jgi:hypothetical protein
MVLGKKPDTTSINALCTGTEEELLHQSTRGLIHGLQEDGVKDNP